METFSALLAFVSSTGMVNKETYLADAAVCHITGRRITTGGLSLLQALHRPSHTQHSHHAGSGVGCVMYALEGTKRSNGLAGNFARNGRTA